MIIFSSRKLEKSLSEQKITSWQKAKYIIIPAIFLSIAPPIGSLFSPRVTERPEGLHSPLQFLFVIISIFITYFGIKSCVKVNEKIDNRDFIERFCILLVPVLFKTFFIFISVFLGLMLILLMSKPLPGFWKKIPLVLFAFGPVYFLTYYSLLRCSFRRFSDLVNSDSSQPVAQADRKD